MSGHFLRIIGSSPFTFKWRAHHLKVIRENCSRALHILNRFHIVANMNEAVDSVRAEGNQPHETRGAAPLSARSPLGCCSVAARTSELNNTPGCAISRATTLKTVRAYFLKEAFRQLWEYSSPACAGKFLAVWCRQTTRSRIEPLKKIARALRNHRELIPRQL